MKNITKFIFLESVVIFSAIAIGISKQKEYRFTTDWVSTANRSVEWLEALKHLKGQPQLEGLEVGSYEGRSALWFLDEILTDKTAHITCVDPWEDNPMVEERFDWNIKVSGQGSHVTKIKGFSQFVLRKLPDHKYDFVYIDGSHNAANVMTDMVLSYFLLKPGGLMICDDYPWIDDPDPVRRPKISIDAFIAAFKPHIEIIKISWLCILKKKTDLPKYDI